ncbi:hypothetical protein [Thiolinea disciformis]|uniref:hypothetical protein n=1 Tax=Thiolinea disciformis TaxID=125614 RepID=UPI0012FF2619|nr:hypothetical protein [Thiolinea disciformis]
MKYFINVSLSMALLFGLSGAVGAAWAGNNKVAEVRLVATINNSPAFQPVSWEVYRVDRAGVPTGLPHTSTRHSFTIGALPPGRYTAVAKIKGQAARKRDFFVMADTTNRINIPLD